MKKTIEDKNWKKYKQTLYKSCKISGASLSPSSDFLFFDASMQLYATKDFANLQQFCHDQSKHKTNGPFIFYEENNKANSTQTAGEISIKVVKKIKRKKKVNY